MSERIILVESKPRAPEREILVKGTRADSQSVLCRQWIDIDLVQHGVTSHRVTLSADHAMHLVCAILGELDEPSTVL